MSAAAWPRIAQQPRIPIPGSTRSASDKTLEHGRSSAADLSLTSLKPIDLRSTWQARWSGWKRRPNTSSKAPGMPWSRCPKRTSGRVTPGPGRWDTAAGVPVDSEELPDQSGTRLRGAVNYTQEGDALNAKSQLTVSAGPSLMPDRSRGCPGSFSCSEAIESAQTPTPGGPSPGESKAVPQLRKALTYLLGSERVTLRASESTLCKAPSSQA